MSRTFNTPTNRGRADKIAEIVAHLENSAKANRASPEQIEEVLAPAIGAIERLLGRALGGEPTSPAPTPPQALQDAAAAPVDGHDRRDIREALQQLTDAQRALRAVVLGWPV